MVRPLVLVTFITAAAGLFGCSSALETGYKPRPLKSSDIMRRSYYAPAFTPAAKAPEMERDQEMEARRPRPGY
jgi:hypothetical protein